MKAKEFLEKADRLLENIVVSGGNVFLLADSRRCLAEAYRELCAEEGKREHEAKDGQTLEI